MDQLIEEPIEQREGGTRSREGLQTIRQELLQWLEDSSERWWTSESCSSGPIEEEAQLSILLYYTHKNVLSLDF